MALLCEAEPTVGWHSKDEVCRRRRAQFSFHLLPGFFYRIHWPACDWIPRSMAFLFITGTDTGVGKTVLTALLTRYLRERGVAVAALKPVCSGGRADARALHSTLDGALTLDEINPWHFRAPLAPLLAARRERRRVDSADVLAHLRSIRRRFDVVLVEGAGGLLSSLGEDFNSRDLMVSLRAVPIIVCPNRLGVLNHVLLTVEALPRVVARRAAVVLMSPRRPDLASRTNPRFLADILGPDRVHKFPWLAIREALIRGVAEVRVRRVLEALRRLTQA